MKSSMIKFAALFFLTSTAVAGATTFDVVACDAGSAFVVAKAIADQPDLTIDADNQPALSIIGKLIGEGKCLPMNISSDELAGAIFIDTTTTNGEKIGLVQIGDDSVVFVDTNT